MLHQVGVSFDLYYDARKHKIKIRMDQFVNTDCLTMTKKLRKVASDNGNVSKPLIYSLSDNTLWHSEVKT